MMQSQLPSIRGMCSQAAPGVLNSGRRTFHKTKTPASTAGVLCNRGVSVHHPTFPPAVVSRGGLLHPYCANGSPKTSSNPLNNLRVARFQKIHKTEELFRENRSAAVER